MEYSYFIPPSGKPAADSISKLYRLIKHNDKYGDLLNTKAGYCYILSRLTGKQADFTSLYERFGDDKPTYKQWRMLYALGKQRAYSASDYLFLVKDILTVSTVQQ